jgi:hypothetical protein
MGAGKMQICNKINAKAGNLPKITGRNREITGNRHWTALNCTPWLRHKNQELAAFAAADTVCLGWVVKPALAPQPMAECAMQKNPVRFPPGLPAHFFRLRFLA